MKDLVFIQNLQAITSSLKVAEVFEKRHDHVMRDIESIIKNLKGLPNFGETPSGNVNVENLSYISMFKLTSYTNEQNGQIYPMYYLNRDGFSLLAMGFTGKKALEFKIKYINAFNAMEKFLISNYKSPADDNAPVSNNCETSNDDKLFDKLIELAKVADDKGQKFLIVNKAMELLGVETVPPSFFMDDNPAPPSSQCKYKLSREQISVINRLYNRGGTTIRELAEIYGVSRETIRVAIKRK